MALLAELALSLMAAGVAAGGRGSVPLPPLPEVSLGWLRIGEKGRQVGRGEGVLWMLCGVCGGGGVRRKEEGEGGSGRARDRDREGERGKERERGGGEKKLSKRKRKTQLPTLHGCTLCTLHYKEKT